MNTGSKKQRFFKLYFATRGGRPSPRIFIYYDRRPLAIPAVFEKDRYYFRLPLGLEEKMIAGELIADFSYAESPTEIGVGKTLKTPCSLILSDRYD